MRDLIAGILALITLGLVFFATYRSYVLNGISAPLTLILLSFSVYIVFTLVTHKRT